MAEMPRKPASHPISSPVDTEIDMRHTLPEQIHVRIQIQMGAHCGGGHDLV